MMNAVFTVLLVFAVWFGFLYTIKLCAQNRLVRWAVGLIVVGVMLLCVGVAYMVFSPTVVHPTPPTSEYVPSTNELALFDEYVRNGGPVRDLPLRYLQDVDRARHNHDATDLLNKAPRAQLLKLPEAAATPTPFRTPSPHTATGGKSQIC
jgi:hypothetical protein